VELAITFSGDGRLREAAVATEILDHTGTRAWLGPTSLASTTHVTIDEDGPYIVRAHLPGWRTISAQVPVSPLECVELDIGARSACPWAYEFAEQTVLLSDARGFLPGGDAWSERFLQLEVAEPGFAVRPVVTTPVPSFTGWLTTPNGIMAIPIGERERAVVDQTMSSTGIHTDSGDADVLLRYLHCGAFEWASVVARPFLEGQTGEFRLIDLVVNRPIASASAAIGYYTVRVLRRGEMGLNHLADRWSAELPSAFPQSSDAAVIRGWLSLLHGDHSEAMESFADACERGVPLYTMGLRYLLDGVWLLSDRGFHLPVEEQWLVTEASLADWDAVLTTLHRERPSIRPLHGIARGQLLLEPARFVGERWTHQVGEQAAASLIELSARHGHEVATSLTSALEGIAQDPYGAPQSGKYRFATMKAANRSFRFVYDIDPARRAVTVLKVAAQPSRPSPASFEL